MTKTMLEGRIAAMLEGIPDGDISAMAITVVVERDECYNFSEGWFGRGDHIMYGIVRFIRHFSKKNDVKPEDAREVVMRGLSDEKFAEDEDEEITQVELAG
ncbi:hypothetical protein KGP36_01890 [Patescibacteria group bacterium]|nr:hypothetical protein [Patescibacteria group bacterium]